MSLNHVLTIGEKLRAVRRQQKLSLRELASLAEVSPSLLSQIENSKTNPSVLTLHNIATALNVPITYFFPDSESVGSQTPPEVTRTEKAFTKLRSADETTVYSVVTAHRSPIVQQSARVFIELMGGVRWQRLTPSDEAHIQFLEIHYPPGAASGSVMSRHAGQEFGIILEGELTLEIGSACHLLTAGDSIIFDSGTPHRLLNEGTEPVRAIWIDMNWSE